MSPEHLLEPTGTCGMAHSIRLILSGRGGKLMGEATLMSTVRIELEEELAALLYQTDRPIQESVREMIVRELYRRGTISVARRPSCSACRGWSSSATRQASAFRTST